MSKQKGLGRGLDALLGGNAEQAKESEFLGTLPISVLRPGKYQPRTRINESTLAELADSIKQRGVIQPILVRPVSAGKYEILAGERRWRAARLAGLEDIPVIVREVADEAALGIALIENIQRENLNPLEEATGIARLIREFNLTHEEAAKAVSRSRSAVSNLLRLLELTPSVQEMLMSGRIDMGHARALLGVSSAKQGQFAQRIADAGMSVREAEQLVRKSIAPPAPGAKKTRSDPDTRRLQEELSDLLGTTVTIKSSKSGRGALTLFYTGLDQLDHLIARLRVTPAKSRA